jgi:polysaccharide export outer membrane protein
MNIMKYNAPGKWMAAALALLICLTPPLGATSIAAAAEKGTTDKPIYTLGSGDKVRVTVFNHTDLSGVFQVADTGAISMSLIGTVEASGLTLREFERHITDMFKDGYLIDPSVTVEVVKFRPFYILGEVNRPGSYPYVSGMTVLNGVALAGGFSSRAKKKGIFITRGDREKKELSATLESVILPGDIIEVPERFF